MMVMMIDAYVHDGYHKDGTYNSDDDEYGNSVILLIGKF